MSNNAYTPGNKGGKGGGGGKTLSFRPNPQEYEAFDWRSVDAETLRHAIGAVGAAGAAIMFGITTDGGAGSICVLDGTQKVKEYPHTAEEASEILVAIREYYSPAK